MTDQTSMFAQPDSHDGIVSRRVVPNLDLARFDGSDIKPERDNARLSGQIQRVYDVMSSGRYMTHAQIRLAIRGKFGVEDKETSISAQVRNLRKPRFGGHTIQSRHIKNGLYEYRIVP